MLLGDSDPFGAGVPLGEPDPAPAAKERPAPETASAPAGDPEANQRLAQLAARVAAARNPDELAAVQRDMRVAAGIDAPEGPEAPPDYTREAEALRMRLVQKMDGATDDEKLAAFDPFDKLGDYHYAKHAETRRKEIENQARAVVSDLLSKLGVTPEDFEVLRQLRDEKSFNPVMDKYGAERVRPLIGEAKKLMAAARAAGYTLDEEAAVQIAAKKHSGAKSAPEDAERGYSSPRRPPVPSAESGPGSGERERAEKTRPLSEDSMREYVERMTASDVSRERFKRFGAGVGSRIVRPESRVR